MRAPAEYETPPSVKRLVRYNVMQPLAYPERYSADAYIPVLRQLAVYGRAGNHIGEAICSEVAQSPAMAAMMNVVRVQVELDQEAKTLSHVEALISPLCLEEAKREKPALIVVEGAELWVSCASADYTFQRRFAEFSTRCRDADHCIVVLVFHVAPSELPPTVRATLMANAVYFPSPSDAWRQAYLKHIFTTFAAHASQQGMSLAHLTVALTDEDYVFLSECAVNLTPEQIRHWCEALFIDLYEMRTSVAELEAEDALVTVDLEFLKRNDKLRSIAGIEWQLLHVDGNALENKYSIDAGVGALAVRDAAAVRERKRARDEAASAVNVTDAPPPTKRQIIQGDGTVVEEEVK